MINGTSGKVNFSLNFGDIEKIILARLKELKDRIVVKVQKYIIQIIIRVVHEVYNSLKTNILENTISVHADYAENCVSK